MTQPVHDEQRFAPRNRVFDTRSAPTEITSSVACPRCGRALTYRLSELGKMLQCPACPDGKVRAGRSLLDEGDGQPTQAAITRPFAVLVVPQRRWRATLVTLVLVGLAALMVAGAGWWTTTQSTALADGWFTWTRVATAEGRAPEGTSLAGGEVVTLPPPEITLAAIDELPRWPDKQKALLQAQVWLQVLLDHNLDDQRVARLREIIAQFEIDLRLPAQPPPAYVLEFRTLLEQARTALAADDFATAGRAIEQAESLLSQHPDELSPYGRSFLALKQRYQQMRLRTEGRQQIADLLVEAGRRIDAEQPTEAAEAIAQAMFLALGTPLDDAEFAAREEQVRELRLRLRLARGKRAVQDAQRCQAQNDLRARDGQLRDALDLLPDLPSEQVTGLLQQADAIGATPIVGPVDTELGRELDFRAAYERALEYQGRRDSLLELARRCVEAKRLGEAASHLGDAPLAKVENLILGALEFILGDLMSLPPDAEELPRGMAMVREALEVARPWGAAAKYRYVEQALQSKEDEIAVKVLRLAAQRAEGGGKEALLLAVRTIEPALTLGSPESRGRARGLHDGWQAEIDRLNRLEAMQRDWDELAALSRAGMHLEAWQGLDRYEANYPDSDRSSQIPAVRRQLRPLVDMAVARLNGSVDGHFAAKQWRVYRESVDKLLRAPEGLVPADRVEQLRGSLVQLDVKANEQYLATESSRKMFNEAQVIDLLTRLPEVLELNPQHRDAEALFKTAREKGQGFAQGRLLRAKNSGPRNPKIYRGHLEAVIQLDPDGKSGAEARKLLAELDAAPPAM
jgi:hypothetical protein